MIVTIKNDNRSDHLDGELVVNSYEQSVESKIFTKDGLELGSETIAVNRSEEDLIETKKTGVFTSTGEMEIRNWGSVNKGADRIINSFGYLLTNAFDALAMNGRIEKDYFFGMFEGISRKASKTIKTEKLRNGNISIEREAVISENTGKANEDGGFLFKKHLKSVSIGEITKDGNLRYTDFSNYPKEARVTEISENKDGTFSLLSTLDVSKMNKNKEVRTRTIEVKIKDIKEIFDSEGEEGGVYDIVTSYLIPEKLLNAYKNSYMKPSLKVNDDLTNKDELKLVV